MANVIARDLQVTGWRTQEGHESADLMGTGSGGIPTLTPDFLVLSLELGGGGMDEKDLEL